MNYTTHAENVTRRLVDMIRTGSHGPWAMPWHTHDLGDLLAARNATTGNRYATGACGVFEPCQCPVGSEVGRAS